MSEMSSQASSRASSVRGRSSASKLSLQSHLYIVVKACLLEYPRKVVMLGVMLELLQILSFALNPHVPGHRATWSIFYFSQVPFWDSSYSTGVTFAQFIPMYWAVVAPLWIAMGVIILGLQLPHFSATNILMPGLSHVVNFFVTAFYVPTLQTLLSAISCGDTTVTSGSITFVEKRSWLFPDELCSDSLHATHYGISIATISVFLIVALVFTACNYSSSMSSNSIRRCSHASIDVVAAAYKAGVCIGFHLLLPRGMGSYYSALVGIGALVLAGSYAFFLPFYSRHTNRLYTVSYAVVAFASFVVLIDFKTRTFSYVQNGGFYATLALGSIIVAFLADKAAQLRYSSQTEFLLKAATTKEFVPPEQNPFALAAAAGDPDLLPFPKNLPESDYVFSPHRNVESDIVEEKLRDDNETDEFANRMQRYISLVQVVSPTIEAVHVATDAEVAVRFLHDWRLLTESQPTAHMLSFACRIFAKTLMKFPTSPTAVIHFLRFLVGYVPSLSRMNLAIGLIDATSNNMFCTVADGYQLFLMGLAVKSALGVRDKSHNVLFRRARRAHKETLLQTASIWQSLVEDEKNVVSLCYFNNSLSDVRKDCLGLYTHALHVMPDDEMLLRNFSTFIDKIFYNKQCSQMCADEAQNVSIRRRDNLQGSAGRGRSEKGNESVNNAGGSKSMISTTNQGSVDQNTVVVQTVEALLVQQVSTLHNNLSTQFLVRSTVLVFVLLAVILAAVAGVTIGTSVARQGSTDRVYQVGNLRSVGLHALSLVYESGNEMDNPSNADLLQLLYELLINANAIEAAMNSVMFGTYTSSDTKLLAALTTQSTILANPYNNTLTYRPMSAWDAMQGYSAALHELIDKAGSHGFSSSSEYFASDLVKFLLDNQLAWSVLFTKVITAVVDAEERITQNDVISVVVVLAVSVSALLGVAFLLMYNFRKAASGKVQALKLFYSIPKDSLRYLLKEAKNAVEHFVSGGIVEQEVTAEQQVPTAPSESGTNISDENDRRVSVSSRLLAHLIESGKIGGEVPAAAKGKLETEKPKAEAVEQAPKEKKGPSFVGLPGSPAGGASSGIPMEKAARRRVSVSLSQATKSLDQGKTTKRLSLLDASRSNFDVSDDEALDGAEHDGQFEDEDPESPAKATTTDVSHKLTGTTLTIVIVCVAIFAAAFAVSIVGSTGVTDGAAAVAASLEIYTVINDIQLVLVRHLVSTFRLVLTQNVDEAQVHVQSRGEIEGLIENLLTVATTVDANAFARYFGDLNRLLDISFISAALAVSDHAGSIAPALASPRWYAIPRSRELVERYKPFVENIDSTWFAYSDSSIDLAQPPAIRQLSATRVIFDGFAVADMSQFRESQRALVASVLGNTTGKTETFVQATSAMFSAATALWAIAVVFACVTASNINSLHMGLRKMLLLAVLVAVVTTALNAVAVISIGDYQTVETTVIGSQFDVASPKQHGLQYTHSSLAYLYSNATQEQLREFLFETEPISYVQQEGFISRSPEGAAQQRISQLRKYFFARSKFVNFVTIADVLAMQAYNNTLLNGTARISSVTWNLLNEEETYRQLLLHPSDAAKLYTNTTFDKTLPSASKLDLARSIVSSHTWRFWYDTFQSTGDDLETGVANDKNAEAATKLNAMLSAVSAAQALSIASLALIAMILFYVGYESIESFSITAEEKQLYNSMYGTIAMQTALAVFFTAAAVITVCILAITYSTENAENERLLAKSSDRSWLVLRSLDAVKEIMHLTTEVSDQLRMQRVLQRIVDPHTKILQNVLFQTQWSESLRGVQNAELFGPQVPYVYRTDFTSQQCYAANNHVNGNEQTSVILYFQYFDIIRRIAYLNADDTIAAAAKGIRNPELTELLDRVQIVHEWTRHRLFEADIDYRDSVKSRQQQQLTILVIVLVVAAVIVTVSVIFVLWPAVKQLNERELGLKLLLTMLPEDIRNSVPDISDYYDVSDGKDDQMKKKLQQSEKLLQNILPPVISRRLKNGERLIADTHPNVTVVFAALIGFDEYSKSMEARQIVHFLNSLIVTFDHIVDLLELEKIKTIGDVYFLCGGLTAKTESDHPLRCMESGILFFEALHEHNVRHNTPNLTLRVGINTDPAVAGVIGSKKVAYDLWGDSVNTSSRMQSTGIPGKIQVSDKTYKLIKDYYSFTDRTVSAKGKGELKTHIYANRLQPTPYSNINWRLSR